MVTHCRRTGQNGQPKAIVDVLEYHVGMTIAVYVAVSAWRAANVVPCRVSSWADPETVANGEGQPNLLSTPSKMPSALAIAIDVGVTGLAWHERPAVLNRQLRRVRPARWTTTARNDCRPLENHVRLAVAVDIGVACCPAANGPPCCITNCGGEAVARGQG